MSKCKCCGQEIKTDASYRFEEFWAVFPTKVKRKQAERTWKSRKLDRIADAIINNVRSRISNDPRWQAGYVPNPTTYLNGDLWDDEIETIQKAIQWPTKNDDWVALGAKHGIHAGTGEDWPQYKDRIRRCLDR